MPIEINDLIKVYRTGKSEVIALRGLNVKINDGEVIVIKGPSGCGKTTLLNLIGGLDRPTAGSIMVDGNVITHFSDAEYVNYRREKIGIVFQFFNLVPTLNAEENISVPMRLLGKPGKERDERTKELLKLVGLEERAIHRPDEMSGGEQQRVAIAIALANDPPIILADEPTGELDTKTGQDMLNLFKTLNKQYGKTVIIVTHDVRASEIANRTFEIVDGTIIGET